MPQDFDPKTDIPDLSGRVFFVTGGNTGLGKEMIRQLALHNPEHIYMAARTAAKAEAAIKDIQTEVPQARITHIPLDLASFSSVALAAKMFNEQSDRLDVLVNNAGILAVPAAQTSDGYEIQFGTNHLGPFLLTKLLMPKLEATAVNPGAEPRVITMSSSAAGMRPFYHLECETSHLMQLGPWMAYSNSKLANLVFAAELAKRHPSVTSISVHPGLVKTDLLNQHDGNGWMTRTFTALVDWRSVPLAEGIKNQLWAASVPRSELKNGGYYVPIGKLDAGPRQAHSAGVGDKLWEYSEAQVKSKGY